MGQTLARTEPAEPSASLSGHEAAWRLSHRRVGLEGLTLEWPGHEIFTSKDVVRGFNSLTAHGSRAHGEFYSKGSQWLWFFSLFLGILNILSE